MNLRSRLVIYAIIWAILLAYFLLLVSFTNHVTALMAVLFSSLPVGYVIFQDYRKLQKQLHNRNSRVQSALGATGSDQHTSNRLTWRIFWSSDYFNGHPVDNPFRNPTVLLVGAADFLWSLIVINVIFFVGISLETTMLQVLYYGLPITYALYFLFFKRS